MRPPHLAPQRAGPSPVRYKDPQSSLESRQRSSDSCSHQPVVTETSEAGRPSERKPGHPPLTFSHWVEMWVLRNMSLLSRRRCCKCDENLWGPWRGQMGEHLLPLQWGGPVLLGGHCPMRVQTWMVHEKLEIWICI